MIRLRSLCSINRREAKPASLKQMAPAAHDRHCEHVLKGAFDLAPRLAERLQTPSKET